MISIEAGPEGFTLSAGGRRVLSHSRKRPCVEIGRSENLVRQGRGAFKPRSRREKSVPLRFFSIVESGDNLAVVAFEDKLELAAFWKDGVLRLTFSRFDPSVNHFRLRLAAWPEERIFGCGERSERLDLKGRSVALWVQYGAAERGSSSFPGPAFVSTRDYWCAVDTAAPTRFDFRRASTHVDCWAVPREIVLGWGADAPSAVAGLGSYLGRPPVPPAWTFDGVLMEVRGGMEELRRGVDALLGAGVRIAAVWARDCCGAAPPGPAPRAMLSLAHDRSLYPGLSAEIAALRARGIRFLGYVAALLDRKGSLYAEASELGFCVKDADGRDYLADSRGPAAAMLDLTDPEAVAWFKDMMRQEMLGLGMSGWLADSGDYLPADAVLASGESAVEAHNRWPLYWAKASREAIDEAGLAAEALLLARSGWLGSGRYVNASWSDHRSVTFSKRDGLPASAVAALSLGLSGGGFRQSAPVGALSAAQSRRNPGCLARWTEMSAFSPLLRVDASLFAGEALAHLARMSGVYAALRPYHEAVAREQAQTGLPALRHPWIHYESDPEARRLLWQYLYGRDLMVAPALAPRARLTELYLPEDEWVHLWSSRCFRGGPVAVESPLGYPAVFYRAASPFADLFDALRRGARRT